MPRISYPKKKNPEIGKDKKFKAMSRSAVEAMLEITSGSSADWTIDEIAAEARARGLIPSKVYDTALLKAVTRWLSDGGRSIKKDVGTPEHPIKVRVMATYKVRAHNEYGELKERDCWKPWEELDRSQMKKAFIGLFKNARAALHEAKVHFNYGNKLLADRGVRGITMDEVKLGD